MSDKKIKWSHYQEAIFAEEINGTENIVVEALPGSGKSTVLLELINRTPEHLSKIMVSFGTKIVDEFKKKTDKIEARTLHSFGYKCLTNTYGRENITVDNDKVYTLIDKTLKKKIKEREAIYNIVNAVSKCKDSLSHSKEEILKTCKHFDIDFCKIKEEDFVNHVQFLLNLCKKYYTTIDLSDQIWLPNVLPVKVQQYDRVFVDEGQDFSLAQIKLTLKMSKGKTYVVGDPNQAIFAFRGADSEAFSKFATLLNAKKLSLPITYRCPVSIVKFAQKLIPDFEAAENAKEGEVKEISYNEMLKMVSPGCVILSRFNAPIVSLAMKLIGEKKPCNIQGRDIGANLKKLIKLSRTKSIDSFLVWLEKWKIKESAKLIKHDKKPDSITDKSDCLKTIAESCESLKDIENTIDDLFYDGNDDNRIILSSCHQFKGLQRSITFVLDYTLRNFNQEERNIKVVSYTRSSDKLYLVQKSTPKIKKEEKNS